MTKIVALITFLTLLANGIPAASPGYDLPSFGYHRQPPDYGTHSADYELPPTKSAEDGAYDLIVVGTEPEGITAAVAAARSGLRTLLISEDPRIGGTLTLAKLNTLDMNYDDKGYLLTRGLFLEFWKKIDRRISFDVAKAQAVLEEMMASEKNITLELNTRVEEVLTEGNERNGTPETLTGLVLRTPRGTERVFGLRFIDATGDGDVAYRAGAPFKYGWEDRGRPDLHMAPTLVFRVADVDWEKAADHVTTQRKSTGNKAIGASKDSIWGLKEVSYSYHLKEHSTYIRPLNIGRQDDGSVLINALILFGVNVLDEASRFEAIQRGTREARAFVEHLRSTAPGFESARFDGVAPKLYVRESRHLVGRYTLTLDDIKQEKRPWDEIAVGSYPVDIQAASASHGGMLVHIPRSGYGIPFRVLVPAKGPDNILVIGRAASHSSVAFGSARVIPVGMVKGEAAGIAAWISIKKGSSFRELAADPVSIRVLQKIMLDRGGYLRPGE